MELIKQYAPPKSLKDYYLDAGDRDLLAKFSIRTWILDRLIRYLDKEGKKVRITETYDSRSGWQGYHFYLDGNDLSGNGYCFSDMALHNQLKSVKA